MSLLQDHIGNLSPLLLCGVDTRRVMCTRVQKEDRPSRCILQLLEESVVGQPDSLGIVIRICKRLDLYVAENCKVIDCIATGK